MRPDERTQNGKMEKWGECGRKECIVGSRLVVAAHGTRVERSQLVTRLGHANETRGKFFIHQVLMNSK